MYDAIMTDKLTQEFNEYNKLMKRLGSKTKTMDQYIQYRSGKLRRGRGKPLPKSPMEATTYRREAPKYPSGDGIGVTIPKKEEKKYTGDKLLGIATMHKSNMVPVFKQEDAEEIARMRR
jgi:hypothetical protein